MEASGCSQRAVTVYKYAWCYIPEDLISSPLIRSKII
jgi:hypothetical protein